MRYTYPGLIDFELEQVGQDLTFTIHEQSPSITNGPGSLNFLASNRMQIISAVRIELTYGAYVGAGAVYIRGSNKKLRSTDTRYYPTVAAATDYFNRALKAFEELAASKGIVRFEIAPRQEQLELWD